MHLPYKILRLAYLIAAVGGGAAACRAEADAAADAELQAIRAAAKDYRAAAHRGDAEKLRTMWTAEGDYIDASGRAFKALELVAQLAPAGESATEAAPAESSLRLIAPTVAIEDGATGYGVAEDGSALTGRFTAIWVKRNGKWLLDGVRESVIAAAPGHPKLKPLDWLIGEWAGKAGDAAIVTSWQWTDGGNYLVGEFLLYGEGRDTVGGTQRIGWDPVAGQIRSWIFDSQGSRGEGHWRHDGDRWLVDSTHIAPDGMKSTTSAIYTPGKNGELILEVTGKWDAPDAAPADGKLPVERFEFRRAASDN